MFNRTTLIVLVVALAAALGLIVSKKVFGPSAPPAPALQSMRLFPNPRVLPAFTLQQSDGTPLVDGELRGHWTLVFIGFTYCPDVCPTALAELAQAQKQWEALPETTRPRVLFVSVDPERDTPDRIGEYAHAFHRDTIAATADLPALENFTRALSLVFAKVPAVAGAPVDAYTIDHSAAIAVLDPQGRMAGVIQPPFAPRPIAADLLTLSKPAITGAPR